MFLVVLFYFVRWVCPYGFYLKVSVHLIILKSFSSYVFSGFFIHLWKIINRSIFHSRVWNRWSLFAMRVAIFVDVSTTVINLTFSKLHSLLKISLTVQTKNSSFITYSSGFCQVNYIEAICRTIRICFICQTL